MATIKLNLGLEYLSLRQVTGVGIGVELSEIRLVDATRLARGAFSKLIPTYQRHVGINFFGYAKTAQLCCRIPTSALQL